MQAARRLSYQIFTPSSAAAAAADGASVADELNVSKDWQGSVIELNRPLSIKRCTKSALCELCL